ncbi:MAG TPA: DnaJ domain-containing protein [Candidatus Limnocylindrales bacterium]|nr:DnaJ domain-containing protein [Candidatus Limnocylindrales bacterium]
MSRPDAYATLGVPKTATDAQIKAAFRRLARRYHPDASAGAEATARDPEDERRFKAIARAYEAIGRPSRRRAYDARRAGGRFGRPGGTEDPVSFRVEGAGPIYHSDLGHHSDFYQAGDPLTVTEAATIVRRDPGWLRGAIRAGRLAAVRDEAGRYLLRRRDVERLDRTARRRRRAPEPDVADAPMPDEAEA